MYENIVLRKMFGCKRDAVTGAWKIVCLCYSPNSITLTKARRMRWKGYVAWIGAFINANRILVGNLNRRDHLEDLDVDGRIILKLSTSVGG
jgi:hypothetical protein